MTGQNNVFPAWIIQIPQVGIHVNCFNKNINQFKEIKMSHLYILKLQFKEIYIQIFHK